jgi:hypothetical protein
VYLCNGVVKTGDSLINPDGDNQRTYSHACSVPRLQYGYIVYLEEWQIILFRKFLEARFKQDKPNRDHFICSIEKAEDFVLSICKAYE